MSNELCILFAYHRVDELTVKHFESLKQHNSNYAIVPITDDISDHLPGTIDVKSFDDPWPKAIPWRRCDTMLYRWFMNRQVTAERYLLLEYDCLCTVDVKEAYKDIWEAEVAARDILVPGEKRNTRFGNYVHGEWYWFNEVDKLPPEDRPHAAGLVPLAGVFFSHHGLQSIVTHATREDVFCELRIGTAAQKAGLRVVEFPESLKRTIWWDPHARLPSEPGVFHAVKFTQDISLADTSLSGTNLALGRPATQSSVSSWSNHPTVEADARGANNGQIDGLAGFHTYREACPWWQVDLQALCSLRTVRIFNRRECADRLRHFRILSSIDGVNWIVLHRKTDEVVFGESDLRPYVAQLPHDCVGRFVRIQLEGWDCLHFCECEVFGNEVPNP
jgi:hypothetical protein